MSRTVAYDGIGSAYVAMKLAAGIVAADEGKAVALTANDTVGLGVDLAPLFGKLIKVEDDGTGTVQYRGFMDFNCVDGLEPALGKQVVVDGTGKVKAKADVNEGGAATVAFKRDNTVTSVDATANTCRVLV